MRKIDRKVFWENAKAEMGEEKWNKAKADFELEEQTQENMVDFLRNTFIPLVREAAYINGCRTTETESNYQRDCIKAFIELIQKFPEALSEGREGEKLKHEEFYPRYEEIGRRYDTYRMCHSTPYEYVCYCDEKPKPAR